MKPLLITSGEPAGIGPDLCLALAGCNQPLVVMGDKTVLSQRAKQLKLNIRLQDYHPQIPPVNGPGQLTVWPVICPEPVVAGVLNPNNAGYVLELLSTATTACLNHQFAGLVTAPIQKEVINQAGFAFTGHTEYLAQFTHTPQVVMLLSSPLLNVALVTTHLPLKDVPKTITAKKIKAVISLIDESFKRYFKIQHPRIAVAGLNPHAGEGGYLGQEELKIINPAIKALQTSGINVQGTFPADTLFNPDNLARFDAFVAMYHDQGLSVLKYASFGEAVNITLGLPFIRTSVDHGTALDKAATGLANPQSLFKAIEMAQRMANP